MRGKRIVVPLALGPIVAFAAACGGDGASDDAGGGELTVLAASSLTESFDELEKSFEAEHDVDVKISYDSSSVLAEQVIQGAPADVLATADERTMQQVVDEGLADGGPRVFAQNILTVVTPPDNPAGITGLRDLASDDVTFAVCVPEAPCGNATQELMKLDDIDAQPATEEQNVKSVLTKVTLGEVDAGIVYVTDARAAGDDVKAIEVKNASKVVNPYPIAVLDDASDSELAQDWVDLVLSKKGQQVLGSYGFQPAP